MVKSPKKGSGLWGVFRGGGGGGLRGGGGNSYISGGVGISYTSGLNSGIITTNDHFC